MKTILIFLTLIFVPKVCGQTNEYSQDAWTKAANFIRSAMNPDVTDLCNNFYDHVCGNFNDTNQGEGGYQTSYREKMKFTMEAFEKIIPTVESGNLTLPVFKREFKQFYDQCTNQSDDFESDAWIKNVYETVETRLGPYPIFGPVEKFDFWQSLGILERQAGIVVGLAGSISTFMKDWDYIPYVAISRSKIMEKFDEMDINFIRRIGKAIGKEINESDSNDLMNRTAALYAAFGTAFGSDQDTSGSHRDYNFTEAIAKWPFLDSYFHALLNETVREKWTDTGRGCVRIYDEDWFDRYVAVVENRDHKEDAFRSILFLSFFMRYGATQFFGAVDPSAGTQVVLIPKSIQDRCLEVVIQMMPAAAARLYFDYLNADIVHWRSEIQLITRNVFSAFRFMINSNDWLDDDEKEKINEKVDRITFYTGVPEWLTDDEKVAQYTAVYNLSQSIYENVVRVKMETFDWLTSQQLTGSLPEEPPPSFEINEFYDPIAKNVKILMGFNLPPYYQPVYPLAVKYGSLGFVIGHELAHAFDADNVRSEANLAKTPWLRNSTLDAFEKRKICLIRQYSKFCDPKLGKCVNGTNAINDNIADTDGLKAAYLAYKIVSDQVGGDVPIPQMVNFTDDQIFFWTAARQWCSRNNPTDFGGTHAIDRARIEIPLRNMPQFAAAFGCPVGSSYAPEKTCSVWGDYAISATKPNEIVKY